jgi:hypothetical protein
MIARADIVDSLPLVTGAMNGEWEPSAIAVGLMDLSLENMARI